jgi:hypothetical protein
MMRVLVSGGDIIEAVFGMDKAVRLKQMIKLSDASAAGGSSMLDVAFANSELPLTEELAAAASYGRLRVCSDPPPEIKPSSSTVPKDKMQYARKFHYRKKHVDSTA